MKKLVAIPLIMVMFLFPAACRDGNNPVTTADPTMSSSPELSPAATETQDRDFQIDIFWCDFEDRFLSDMRDTMEEGLADMPNADYNMHDCENDQDIQHQKVENAIADGTDMLVVNIVSTGIEGAAQSIVDLARENDLPIVFFISEVFDEVVNSYDKCCYVGVDDDEGGESQGEMAANFLLDKSSWADGMNIYDLDGDGEIKYILFGGMPGAPMTYGRAVFSVVDANERLEGSGIKLFPSSAGDPSPIDEYYEVSCLYLYWSYKVTADLMRDILKTHSLTDGGIELILASNDDMALGAIEAMNEVGFNTGEPDAGYIPVFGIDAVDLAREAIADGKMSGTTCVDKAAMADCILTLVQNVVDGNDLMYDTGIYNNIDEQANKIRTPYIIVAE